MHHSASASAMSKAERKFQKLEILPLIRWFMGVTCINWFLFLVRKFGWYTSVEYNVNHPKSSVCDTFPFSPLSSEVEKRSSYFGHSPGLSHRVNKLRVNNIICTRFWRYAYHASLVYVIANIPFHSTRFQNVECETIKSNYTLYYAEMRNNATTTSKPSNRNLKLIMLVAEKYSPVLRSDTT